MPTSPPTLSKFQLSNLVEVCAIGPGGLSAAADRLDAADLVLAKGKVDSMLAESVGVSAGEELSRFLFGVMANYRQNPDVADAVLQRITDYAASHPDERGMVSWPACRPAVERLLGSQSIKLAAKAIDVSYDFERVYGGGRFLTTMRPVFDEERIEIMGVAVVQTLRIEFFSGDAAPANLSIAMDRLDIKQLRRSCDEALRKSDVAYRTATEGWGIPTVISGDSEDEAPTDGQLT